MPPIPTFSNVGIEFFLVAVDQRVWVLGVKYLLDHRAIRHEVFQRHAAFPPTPARWHDPFLVDEVEPALRWYREKLEFEVQVVYPDTPPYIYATLTHGDSLAGVMLLQKSSYEQDITQALPPGSAAEVTLDDPRDLYDLVRGRVELDTDWSQGTDGRWGFTIVDVNGFRVRFVEFFGQEASTVAPARRRGLAPIR